MKNKVLIFSVLAFVLLLIVTTYYYNYNLFYAINSTTEIVTVTVSSRQEIYNTNISGYEGKKVVCKSDDQKIIVIDAILTINYKNNASKINHKNNNKLFVEGKSNSSDGILYYCGGKEVSVNKISLFLDGNKKYFISGKYVIGNKNFDNTALLLSGTIFSEARSPVFGDVQLPILSKYDLYSGDTVSSIASNEGISNVFGWFSGDEKKREINVSVRGAGVGVLINRKGVDGDVKLNLRPTVVQMLMAHPMIIIIGAIVPLVGRLKKFSETKVTT